MFSASLLTATLEQAIGTGRFFGNLARMSARADLLRMLEDADCPEQELHAEVLALVAKTKMSTKDIRRVCGDFGLEATATCKQQTREQLLTSLVSKALVRARREEEARAEPAADKPKEDTVSVPTKHTSVLQNPDVLQAMSAKKRTSSTQHEKPEEGCNQDELSREKMKEHPTPVDELPPGEESRMIQGGSVQKKKGGTKPRIRTFCDV